MPPKYFKGLSEKQKEDKKKNIKESKKLFDEGKKKQAFELSKKRPTIKSNKKSSYTTRFKSKFPNVKPLTQSFANATGISLTNQKEIYKRGLGAFVTAGSRSSVSSAQAWSYARLYAFYFKALQGKNKINQDQDIYDKIKNKIK